MKKEWKNSKTIYYHDELNDDFNETSLKRKPIPQNFSFGRNKKTKVLDDFLYYGLVRPILSIGCFFNGLKVLKNDEYKAVRNYNGGLFIYGNHVAIQDVFKIQSYVLKKRTNIIGFTDSLSLGKVIRCIIRASGYLPLPSDSDFRKIIDFQKEIKYRIECDENILIYPEAHIWPYYTKIRNFKNGSFHYPAVLMTPAVPFVTVWRKVWWRKRPCQTIIFGKIIYPNPNFSNHENRDFLHKKCLESMKSIAENTKQYEYIRYIYEEKNDKK